MSSSTKQRVVSRQSSLLGAGFPFHDTCSSSDQRVLWCRSPPLSADNHCLPGAEFHFTIPVAVRACWGLAQITPVVSRQSSLLGRDFHFTIPVVVRASGCSGADHRVVSRQSLFARGRIPFHDTCSSSGLLGSDADNPRCQPTIAASQGQHSISRYL